MTISKLLRGALAFASAAAISALGYAACSTTNGPVGNPGTWTADATGEVLTYSGNGLSYTKCQLGTSGATCATGALQTFTWQDALQASVAARVGGFSDWRVPNLQEAVALMEPTCNLPALSSAFPAASGGQQWTSTTSGAAFVGNGAWNINSYGGSASVIAKTSLRSVILVRGGSTPSSNYDALPAAVVSLTPSTATTSQNAPFNVVISIPSPATTLLGVSLAVLTQPAGPTASLTGSVFCSIPTGSSSCTVTGMMLSGPVGLYTLTASTAGGPPGGVVVNASPTIDLLAGPSATLSAPATANQFAPFNVVLSMSSAATADTSFEIIQSGGPAGVLDGSRFCTVVTSATSCTFTGLTFAGYGTGLLLSAGSIAGPNVPVSDTTLDIIGSPVSVTMGAQAVAQVGSPFSTVFQIDVALPIPVTMSAQAAPGGPAGTFAPTTCVIPAGSLSCTASGNTFSGVGTLFMDPILTASVPILWTAANSGSIDVVLQGATLAAPATVVQFAPFNVSLTLAAGAATTTTFTLSQAAGPSGTLGGGTTCTVPAANLSCTFTGVTFSGSGTGLSLTAAATSGPAIPVVGALLDVTAAPISVAINAPGLVTVGTPFGVTFSLNSPAPVALTLELQASSGPAGALSGNTICTVPMGASTCSLSGLVITQPGSFTFSAVATSTVRVDVTVSSTSVIANQNAVGVPTLGSFAQWCLALLTLVWGAGAIRRSGSDQFRSRQS